MFNQSELNSAAAAIAGAYQLVNFACTSQAPGDWDSHTILECDAILLKFRCYHKDRELNLSSTPHPVPVFYNPHEQTIQGLPGLDIDLLPISKRETLTQQEEEERLIRQIEAALMCTIANLEEKEKQEVHETNVRKAETSEAEVYARKDTKLSAAGACGSKSTRATVRKLRNLQRLISDVSDDDDALTKQFGRFFLTMFLRLFNTLSARCEIRLAPLLDGVAHLSYEFGLKKESLDLHQQALELKHNWLGRKHVSRVFNLDALARICSEIGEFENAESYYMEAVTLREIYQQDHATSRRKLQST